MARKILMIDDEKFHHEVARYYIEEMGYEMISAKNGEEGIEKALSENPDMVIVDLIMPKKDGFEVCKSLREIPETSNIPILMLSGFEGQDIKARSEYFGASDYMAKPYSPTELSKKIKEIISLN